MFKGSFKRLLRGGMCLMLGLGAACAQAQDWPNKAVHLLVGFAPGGGTDIVGARPGCTHDRKPRSDGDC